MIKLFLSILLPLMALANSAPFPIDEPGTLVVHNRILAKVQGKTISVLDVVKKMDVFLNRHYPQYANSKGAKYQFYTSHWRDTLNQLVESELMMSDAESREIKVTDGEIREEIQLRFGPNVMGTLHNLNLTYDEARKMVHQDMIVQRMNWFRVTSKALQQVNSLDVKEAYRQYSLQNPPKEEWEYQMVSLRSTSFEASELLAHKMCELLRFEGVTLEAAAEELTPDEPAAITINVSAPNKADDKTLSPAHREILSKLSVGAFSAPILQHSRDGSPVVRIFHLKSHTRTETPKFETVASQLKDSLLQKAADDEMTAYVTKLRQRFGYDEKSLDFPPDFQPFELK